MLLLSNTSSFLLEIPTPQPWQLALVEGMSSTYNFHKMYNPPQYHCLPLLSKRTFSTYGTLTETVPQLLTYLLVPILCATKASKTDTVPVIGTQIMTQQKSATFRSPGPLRPSHLYDQSTGQLIHCRGNGGVWQQKTNSNQPMGAHVNIQ